jgi:hypothetical protein
MKINPPLPLILIAALGCHSRDSHSGNKPSPAPAAAAQTTPTPATTANTTWTAADTTKRYPDSTKANPDPPKDDKPMVLNSHLRDTFYTTGNFILFLRPNDERYNELDKDPDGGVAEGDSDFGVGISNTQDSLAKNDRYKNIRALISAKRYIFIKDCKGGPLTIDRDSISYGTILSAKGRQIQTTWNSIHSGDYLDEIDQYFFPH